MENLEIISALITLGFFGVLSLLLIFYFSYFNRGLLAGKTAVKNFNKSLLEELERSLKKSSVEEKIEFIRSKIWNIVSKPRVVIDAPRKIQNLRDKKEKLEKSFAELLSKHEKDFADNRGETDNNIEAIKKTLEIKIQKIETQIAELENKLSSLELEKVNKSAEDASIREEFVRWKQEQKKTRPFTFFGRQLEKTGNILVKSIDNLGVVAHLWPVIIFITLIVSDYFVSSQLNIAAQPIWEIGDGSRNTTFTVAILMFMIFAFEGIHIFCRHESCPIYLKRLFQAMSLLVGLVTLITIPVALYIYRFETVSDSFAGAVYMALFFGVGFLAALFLTFVNWREVWRAIQTLVSIACLGILSFVLLVFFVFEYLLSAVVRPVISINSFPKHKQLVVSLKTVVQKIEGIILQIDSLKNEKVSILSKLENVADSKFEQVNERFNQIKQTEEKNFEIEMDKLEKKIERAEQDQRAYKFRLGVYAAIDRRFNWE